MASLTPSTPMADKVRRRGSPHPDKLGCFTAFLSCMDEQQFCELKMSVLAAADAHLGDGIATDFSREQAESWLFGTHSTSPVGAAAARNSKLQI